MHTPNMSSTPTPPLSLPPPPPPPPPPLPQPVLLQVNSRSRNNIPNLENVNKCKETDGNLVEKMKSSLVFGPLVGESLGFSSRREQMLQQLNDIYNKNYPESNDNVMQRDRKVTFAETDNIVDVREDEWFDDGSTLITGDFNEQNKQVSTTMKGNECENEECSTTYYMCRSKDSDTPIPINLCFPVKTNVIIIDRRKTDNGFHDFICSLNVSKEGKKKLNEQRIEEANLELKSLPKGNIAQILKQLRNQQDDHDNENENTSMTE